MIRILFAGAALLVLASACDKPADQPVAETGDPIAVPQPLAPEALDSSGRMQTVSEAISQFDPSRQRFIWVLPEGVHGAGPWDIDVTVRHRGEVKFETSIPLKAEVLPAASRPEFPAGSEVVRLSDDGSYQTKMVEVQKVIDGLIAQFGRGDGELRMESELKTTIDAEHRNAYCVQGKKPEVRFFREEDNKLTAFSLGPLAPLFEASILKNCSA